MHNKENPHRNSGQWERQEGRSKYNIQLLQAAHRDEIFLDALVHPSIQLSIAFMNSSELQFKRKTILEHTHRRANGIPR